MHPLRRRPLFDILNGFDEMLLCGMAVAHAAAWAAPTTIRLRTYQNIYDAFMAGDLEPQARAAQQESVDIVHVIINHGGGIRGGKAIMKLVGIDCGDADCPRPYTERPKYAGWTTNSGRSASEITRACIQSRQSMPHGSHRDIRSGGRPRPIRNE